MITAIAVDDEPLALTIIEAFCRKLDFVELQKTFTETSEALKHLRKYPVDLLFLDINMPAMSGIDFYKSVAQNTMVIFTTAFSEYAVEGFNLNAVDYLLKPFEFERFKRATEKAKEYDVFLNNKDSGTEQYLFIRADYSLIKIAIADHVYRGFGQLSEDTFDREEAGNSPNEHESDGGKTTRKGIYPRASFLYSAIYQNRFGT